MDSKDLASHICKNDFSEDEICLILDDFKKIIERNVKNSASDLSSKKLIDYISRCNKNEKQKLQVFIQTLEDEHDENVRRK